MKKEKKERRKLIIDGNLLARKSFYKFRELKSTILVKNLGYLSKKVKEQTVTLKKEEENKFVSDGSGRIINIKENSRIEGKINQIIAEEGVVSLNTGVLYGMLRSILVAYGKFKIEEVIICYDPVYHKDNGIQLRKEINSEYKNRKKDPDTEREFNLALSLAQSFFYKIGILQVTTTKFEADDILQYYTHKIFKEEECIILTNDHDLFQLLEPNRVKMLRLGVNPDLYTAKKFKEEYKISSKQYKDVLVLGGCSTDNVKGVKGISEKSAIDLIREFKSLKILLKKYKTSSNKRAITALDKDKKTGFKSLKESYRLVSLYGLKKELKDDLSIIKSSKSPEIRYKQAITFLKILKFKSFLTKSAKKSLKLLIS